MSGPVWIRTDVALAIHHKVLGNDRRVYSEGDGMHGSYLGPKDDDAGIEAFLQSVGAVYERYDGEDALIDAAAKLLADEKVVGWHQGRMEFGPRALGGRSILGDPRSTKMQSVMNLKIKYRESFRPFAPSVLLEATGDYFDQSYPDPFMLKVYNVRPEKRAVIPAVTHVDGTGRLQTVDRATVPLYWQLIKEFENLTGVPVVLNTSFNENEPVVCRPEEAVECFQRTRMDALALGNHLVRKP